ncbi:MAG TPA: fumarylacetoacetate hydrolase family protein [Alphaproteobacteria bacterium]|nr:fumarylacetoacetate hydrolase family protein [Alphaproteobacteria bacterium]
MQFARFLDKTGPHPALIGADGSHRSLKSLLPDIRAEAFNENFFRQLKAVKEEALPILEDNLPVLPCVAGVGKIIAIGKNYADHAKELGGESPAEPIIFLKATSSLSGAFDPILLPRGSTKLDWEVELAVIIGAAGRYIEEARAMNHVLGYALADDVSERGFQTERQGQWTKGKSHDSFCPLGPYLVMKSDVPDAQNLSLWLEVNGQRMQSGSTRDMTFKIPYLIHYVSQFMSLSPGDVLLTGTPPGVGKGMNPPRYLKPGDVVRLGIDGLGEQRHEVVPA